MGYVYFNTLFLCFSLSHRKQVQQIGFKKKRCLFNERG